LYLDDKIVFVQPAGFTKMDEETKALLRSIAHHLKWVIVLLLAIIAVLINQSLG
jgi:hypothetical protein